MTPINPDRIKAAAKAACLLQLADDPSSGTISSEHVFDILSDFSLPIDAEGPVEQAAEALWRSHLNGRR